MASNAWGTNIGWDFSFQAVTDLSTSQFLFCKIDSSEHVAVNTVAGGPCLGVIQDGPVGTSAIPKATSVRLGGPSKVVAGAAIQAGQLLTSDSNGKAVPYTGATVFTGTPYIVSGSQVLGVCLVGAAALNDVGTINFNPQGLAAAGLTA